MVLIGSAWLGTDASSAEWRLAVSDQEGRLLHEVVLPDSGFALRYRNSVYGSLAEERFEVANDGRIRLRELAAEDPAVLAEYYRLAGAPYRLTDVGEMTWAAIPEHATVVDELPIAATELGERTLVVEGEQPLALWSLVAGVEPGLVLKVVRER